MLQTKQPGKTLRAWNKLSVTLRWTLGGRGSLSLKEKKTVQTLLHKTFKTSEV